MLSQISVRCCHCGAPISGAWHAWHRLWGACPDCRAWQEWLWQQRAPGLVTNPTGAQALADALAEEHVPGEDR
jgi:hypothetical protein